MSDQSPSDADMRVDAALKADIPNVYVNGFVTRLSTSDIMLVLERNSAPAVVVNMSYTIAKSVVQSLGMLVATLEDRTGRSMLTSKEIEQALSENAGQQPNG